MKKKLDELSISHMRAVVRDTGVEMIAMQRRLHDAGLHATAARINLASQKLGWEAAKIIEKSE